MGVVRRAGGGDAGRVSRVEWCGRRAAGWVDASRLTAEEGVGVGGDGGGYYSEEKKEGLFPAAGGALESAEDSWPPGGAGNCG